MFEQKRCINNIYFLAKQQNKKIGDIEKAAGVSSGYISKLNREDNTSVPGIEFLEKVANEFDVTVDSLIHIDLKQLSPMESYVQKFIDKLIKMTCSGALSWIGESSNVVNEESDKEVDNPLVSVVQNYSPEFDKLYSVHVYQSRFNEKSSVNGTCYRAELPRSTARVYLMNVKYEIELEHKINTFSDTVIEVYIVDDVAEPICSTYYVVDELKESILDLYKMIDNAKSKIGLSKNAKKAIDFFLNSIEEGE